MPDTKKVNIDIKNDQIINKVEDSIELKTRSVCDLVENGSFGDEEKNKLTENPKEYFNKTYSEISDREWQIWVGTHPNLANQYKEVYPPILKALTSLGVDISKLDSVTQESSDQQEEEVPDDTSESTEESTTEEKEGVSTQETDTSQSFETEPTPIITPDTEYYASPKIEIHARVKKDIRDIDTKKAKGSIRRKYYDNPLTYIYEKERSYEKEFWANWENLSESEKRKYKINVTDEIKRQTNNKVDQISHKGFFRKYFPKYINNEEYYDIKRKTEKEFWNKWQNFTAEEKKQYALDPDFVIRNATEQVIDSKKGLDKLKYKLKPDEIYQQIYNAQEDKFWEEWKKTPIDKAVYQSPNDDLNVHYINYRIKKEVLSESENINQFKKGVVKKIQYMSDPGRAFLGLYPQKEDEIWGEFINQFPDKARAYRKDNDFFALDRVMKKKEEEELKALKKQLSAKDKIREPQKDVLKATPVSEYLKSRLEPVGENGEPRYLWTYNPRLVIPPGTPKNLAALMLNDNEAAKKFWSERSGQRYTPSNPDEALNIQTEPEEVIEEEILEGDEDENGTYESDTLSPQINLSEPSEEESSREPVMPPTTRQAFSQGASKLVDSGKSLAQNYLKRQLGSGSIAIKKGLTQLAASLAPIIAQIAATVATAIAILAAFFAWLTTVIIAVLTWLAISIVFVVMILFIINSGAYLVPPGGFGYTEEGSLGLFSVKNISTPSGSVPNGKITVKYEVTISATNGDMTNIYFTNTCRIAPANICPAAENLKAGYKSVLPQLRTSFNTLDEIHTALNSITKLDPYVITYERTYSLSDSSVADTMSVSAFVSSIQSTVSNTASLCFGNCPKGCFEFVGDWPDDAKSVVEVAASNIAASHPNFVNKICADGNIKLGFDSSNDVSYCGWHVHRDDVDIILRKQFTCLVNIDVTEFLLAHETSHHLVFIDDPDKTKNLFELYRNNTATASEIPLCTYPVSPHALSEDFAEMNGLYVNDNISTMTYRADCLGNGFQSTYPAHWEFARSLVFEE